MKLIACIAFQFKPERLAFLQQVMNMQQYLADEVSIWVTTNTDDPQALEQLHSIAPERSPRCQFNVKSVKNLPNPWFLTWAHKPILYEAFQDPSYTHFLYTEDDIELTQINMQYWLGAREILRPYGLYPSFVRVEWSEKSQDWVSTDVTEPIYLSRSTGFLSCEQSYGYVNFTNPYQGMFLYDRELMAEHIASESFDFFRYGNMHSTELSWGGGTAERANFALTFMNVPNGFTSRNVVPFLKKYMTIDVRCMVHHLPNNYANSKPDSKHGKILIKDLLRA